MLQWGGRLGFEIATIEREQRYGSGHFQEL
jgi:hypothetical protein